MFFNAFNARVNNSSRRRRREAELKARCGGRRLTQELLEKRELFSVSKIGLASGKLVIESNDSATTVQVNQVGKSLQVSDIGSSKTWTFAVSKVKTVEFHGGRGNDGLYNSGITIPIVAYGYRGNDILVGGSGNDTLEGGIGDDQVYGSGGNDTLRGQDGNDVLIGGAGHDQMAGHKGNDRLYGEIGNDGLSGGDGNDLLYGGAGVDELDGGHGNDGLFGGVGAVDTLIGGAGADRFLALATERVEMVKGPLGVRLPKIVQAPEDRIKDRAGDDASVSFFNMPATSANMDGIGPTRWAAGAWNDNEIQIIDGALANLHEATGNTRLLKLFNGADLSFGRVGPQTTTGTGIGAYNSGQRIVCPDATFTGTLPTQLSTIYHEIGHNWDDTAENPFTANFRAIAGWKQASTKPVNFTASDAIGDNWYYRSTAMGFAWNYGRHTPLEDYATSLAAYMDKKFHNSSQNFTPSQSRLDVVAKLFASLA